MKYRRYIKAAVSIEEYLDICARADVEGMTLAGYLRAALVRDVDRQSLEQKLAEIHAALPREHVPSNESVQLVLQELLQLVRLMASHANPQAAARISASIKSQLT